MAGIEEGVVIKNSDLYPVDDNEVQAYRRDQLAGDVPVPPWHAVTEEGRERWREDYRAALVGLTDEEQVEQSGTGHITTRAELNLVIAATFERIKELNDTKGCEYAGDADALANFRNRAEQLDLDPLKVWGIFFGKHADAIFAFIRVGKVLSEPIEGRIDDAILYLILLRALVKERGV